MIYASLAYNDEQYSRVQPRLPVLPCLHASAVLFDGGKTTHRKLRTATDLARVIDTYYGKQLTRSYDGPLCVDFEPWNGVNGPNKDPITVEEVNRLVVEAVQLVKTVVKDAKVGVWGIPSSNVYLGSHAKDMEPEDLAPVWAVCDYVMPHDYTRAVHFNGSQRRLSAGRISDAAATGLPVIPFISPRSWPGGDSFIPQEVVVERAKQLLRLGVEAVCYWDGLDKDESMAAQQRLRWDSDAWHLLDL